MRWSGASQVKLWTAVVAVDNWGLVPAVVLCDQEAVVAGVLAGTGVPFEPFGAGLPLESLVAGAGVPLDDDELLDALRESVR